MSKPIKPGDLVVVVRACCEEFKQQRTIFTVTGFWKPVPTAKCHACKTYLPDEPFAWSGQPSCQTPAFPVSWLKRIPPLGELDDVKRDEEITA